MKIGLEPVGISDKKTLGNMLVDYEKEVTGNAGEYKYLDSYWVKSDRFPYFIKADGKRAGFALVNSYCLVQNEGKSVSEFYIKKEYRKQGVGKKAAIMIFEIFPGKWEIREIKENPKAWEFWTKVIGQYTNNNFSEVLMDNDRWRGWVQTFG